MAAGRRALVDDSHVWRAYGIVEPDPDLSLLAAVRRTVPRGLAGLQQVPFQPGGLVRGVADDRLHPGDAGDHRRQMTAVAEVAPIRGDPTAQADRATQVEDPPRGIPKPVHTG